MPNWSDDEGRYWWNPPGSTWLDSVEIPHPPVSVHKYCLCAYCEHNRPLKKNKKSNKKSLTPKFNIFDVVNIKSSFGTSEDRSGNPWKIIGISFRKDKTTNEIIFVYEISSENKRMWTKMDEQGLCK